MQRLHSFRRISAVLALVAVLIGLSAAVPVGVRQASATTAPAMVYGKVTKITASTIYLSGSYLNRGSMTWQISTNSRTKYLNVKNKKMKRSAIRVGHGVTAVGQLVNHTFRITNVTEIDDWNVKK